MMMMMMMMMIVMVIDCFNELLSYSIEIFIFVANEDHEIPKLYATT